jgi:hypothetical protein
MTVIVEHRNFFDLREQPLIYFRNAWARKRLGLAVCGLECERGREHEEGGKPGKAKDPAPQSHAPCRSRQGRWCCSAIKGHGATRIESHAA